MADEAKTDEKSQRASGRSLTWLWMILALVVVGAFLTWLGMESEPTTVVVVDEDEGGEEALEPGVTAVPKDTLAADKSRYEGQRIRVARVEATGSLGPQIFWGELGDRSNQVPILVRLDSAAAEGWEMRSGAFYTLTGTVHRMADSLATQWGEMGQFAGEGEQMQAAFADYYIQGSRVRPSRGGDDADDTGAEAGGMEEEGAESSSGTESPTGG